MRTLSLELAIFDAPVCSYTISGTIYSDLGFASALCCVVLCCRLRALPAELPWWLSRKNALPG